MAAAWSDRFHIETLRQTGKGKADAVRLGFAHASEPLLTILDADLTMPPEMLGRYHRAYCDGMGDFINGSRLVYPMEGDAMRFLNRLGNVFFAKLLSWVLDVRIGDSLCGTKLVTRHDYRRIIAWRKDFGDFDPFGDFELLFPATILGLGIIDIPVRYPARSGTARMLRIQQARLINTMSSVRNNSLLLILPVSLVVLSILLLKYQGPYYLGDYFEDYTYLLNGLNILTFHSPGHTDHPGTTLQLLSASLYIASG